MRRLKFWIAPLLAAAVLVGCSGPEGAVYGGGLPGNVTVVNDPDIPIPAAEPSYAPLKGEIRTTKLVSAEWTDTVANKTIPMTGGVHTEGGLTWIADVRRSVYGDANGDGYEDVLVFLVKKGANIDIEYAYIWLWDPEKQSSRQLADPIGMYGPCSNVLVSVRRNDTSGFVIDEKVRDPLEGRPCGEDPPHRVTRTVAVQDDVPVMLLPYLGYGGVCYPSQAETTTFKRARTIHVAPAAEAPIAARETKMRVEYAPWAERAWPDGWQLVSWVTPEMEEANQKWGICGFTWWK